MPAITLHQAKIKKNEKNILLEMRSDACFHFRNDKYVHRINTFTSSYEKKRLCQ